MLGNHGLVHKKSVAQSNKQPNRIANLIRKKRKKSKKRNKSKNSKPQKPRRKKKWKPHR